MSTQPKSSVAQSGPESVAASLLGSAPPGMLPANATGDEQSSAALAPGGKLTGKDDANRSRPHSAAPCTEIRNAEPVTEAEAEYVRAFDEWVAIEDWGRAEVAAYNKMITARDRMISERRKQATAASDSTTPPRMAPGPKLPSD